MSIHIEITGVSGAGKSTIARAIKDELQVNGVSVAAPKLGRSEQVPTTKDTARHCYTALKFFLRHPVVTVRLAYYSTRWGIKNKTIFDKFIPQQFFAAVAVKVKLEQDTPVSITDHGTLAFMSFYSNYKQIEKNFYKNFLELVYPPKVPKVIVAVETVPEVVIERKKQRKRVGLKRGTKKVSVAEIEDKNISAHNVIATVDDMYERTTIVTVDGEKAPMENARKVLKKAVELDKRLNEENILPERLHERYG